MPVVQCDVTGVKNTTLDDGNNDDQKITFHGYTSITFLELIFCIVLVS